MRRKKQINRNEKAAQGFTLIESLFAILILALGITAVLGVFSSSLNIENFNKMKTQAALLAQEKIEEADAHPYKDLAVGTTTENSLESPFVKFSRTTIISYVDSNLQTTTSDSGLKEIKVIVSWPSSIWAKESKVELASLVARH